MKKLAAVIILTMSTLFLFAEGFDYISNGEYAFYRDTRGEMNFIRGYCVFQIEEGSTLFLIRNLDMKTGTSLNMVVEMTTDSEGLPAVIDISGMPEGAPPEFSQSMVDIMNFVTLYNSHREEIAYGTIIRDNWKSYYLQFDFNLLFPVFRFRHILFNDEKKPVYRFIRGGIISINDYESFFTMNPQAQPKVKKKFFPKIKGGVAKKVEMRGVTCLLDNRWEFNAATGSPGYWFNYKTGRDSQINVEFADNETLTGIGITSLSEFMLKSIAYTNGFVLYETLEVSEDGQMTIAEFSVIDANNRLNYTRYSFIRDEDGIRIINFSGFQNALDRNEDYYRAIFESIRVE